MAAAILPFRIPDSPREYVPNPFSRREVVNLGDYFRPRPNDLSGGLLWFGADVPNKPCNGVFTWNWYEISDRLQRGWRHESFPKYKTPYRFTKDLRLLIELPDHKKTLEIQAYATPRGLRRWLCPTCKRRRAAIFIRMSDGCAMSMKCLRYTDRDHNALLGRNMWPGEDD